MKTDKLDIEEIKARLDGDYRHIGPFLRSVRECDEPWTAHCHEATENADRACDDIAALIARVEELEAMERLTASKLEKAQAENERLREALHEIARYDKGQRRGICPYGCDTPNLARAALEDER